MSTRDDFYNLKLYDSHFVAIKRTVVVHDVHGTAVEKVSQPSHFVWCDGVNRIYGNMPCMYNPEHT